MIDKLNLTGTETLLDVGCGAGKVTVEISAHVPQGKVVGVDNSEAMIVLANREYPANRFNNLAFQQMDASELDFNGRFDVVFSNAVLHWIDDHRPVLSGKLSSCQSPDHPQSVRTMVQMHNSLEMSLPWFYQLEQVIRSGGVTIESALGLADSLFKNLPRGISMTSSTWMIGSVMFARGTIVKLKIPTY